MSGAAISPSMGKVTRPSVRFLLAMANVRLGVWIPNPRRIESFVRMRSTLRQRRKGIVARCTALLRPSSWEEQERFDALRTAEKKTRWMPRPTPYYLLKELMGWNSVNDKFLYVSDGGHYENLGLVELLRRGCTRIYCFDASGGLALGELGDAIALARSEIGVEVTFPDGALEALEEDPETKLAQRSCAVGTLRYLWSPEEVTGTIVYTRTAMTPDLPWDVQAFRRHDPSFPHHSTLDQLFTDQKFEAYRVLGFTAGNAAMQAMDAATQPPPPQQPPADDHDAFAPAPA
jgi:hypothetical protein